MGGTIAGAFEEEAETAWPEPYRLNGTKGIKCKFALRKLSLFSFGKSWRTGIGNHLSLSVRSILSAAKRVWSLFDEFRHLDRQAYFFLLLAFPLAACGADRYTKGGRGAHLGILPPSFDTSPAAEEYRRLCREKAGPHIYQIVENVRGFLDQAAKYTSLYNESVTPSSGYEFVEYRVPWGMSEASLVNHYVPGPGLYRYTSAPSTSPKCERFYKRFEVGIRRGLPLDKRFDGVCIVATPIENISAKHRVYYYSLKPHETWSEINETYTQFSSIDGSKTYAEHYRYRYVPDYAETRFASGFQEHYRCPGDGTGKEHPPSIKKIFKPSMSMRKR